MTGWNSKNVNEIANLSGDLISLPIFKFKGNLVLDKLD